MILTKSIHSTTGLIEYQVSFNYSNGEDDVMIEYNKFNSLPELLSSLSENELNKIKTHYDADCVIVSSVTFNGFTDQQENILSLFISEEKVNGTIVTEIKNEDIDNRLLNNMNTVKKIIDNALEQYPIKY